MIKTIIFSSILVLLACIGLGIGYLLTGKEKFTCKRCGLPEEKDREKKRSCDLCANKDKCKKNKNKNTGSEGS